MLKQSTIHRPKKKKKRILPLHKKLTQKQVDLYLKCKTIKHLEKYENIFRNQVSGLTIIIIKKPIKNRKNHLYCSLYFYIYSQFSIIRFCLLYKKENLINWTSTELKKILLWKTSLRRMIRQAIDQEKIFADNISDKEQLLEQIKSSPKSTEKKKRNQNKQAIQLKNGPKKGTYILLKNIQMENMHIKICSTKLAIKRNAN